MEALFYYLNPRNKHVAFVQRSTRNAIYLIEFIIQNASFLQFILPELTRGWVQLPVFQL